MGAPRRAARSLSHLSRRAGTLDFFAEGEAALFLPLRDALPKQIAADMASHYHKKKSTRERSSAAGSGEPARPSGGPAVDARGRPDLGRSRALAEELFEGGLGRDLLPRQRGAAALPVIERWLFDEELDRAGARVPWRRVHRHDRQRDSPTR